MQIEKELTIDEKREYVDRITKKANEENITFKHASQKLGCKVWAYYKYKSELRKLDIDRSRFEAANGKNGTVEEHRQNMPITLNLSVTPEVMYYLEREAEGYATDADIVAQILLHDCVKGKMNKVEPKQEPKT